MAQESGSQNKNMGLSQNQIFGILGVLAAALIVLAIIWNANQNNDQVAEETPQEVTDGQNGQQNGQNGDLDGDGASTDGNGQVAGNISSSGVLRASDNLSRGNYMLLGEDGKIYVSTQRDYSSLVDRQVALSAEGSLNSFTFLDFTAQSIDAGDVGGAPEETSDVTFTGTLQRSNSAHGNYTISSGNTTVYLQTVHDYSAWVGSQVELNAEGSLDSFTGATLQKI